MSENLLHEIHTLVVANTSDTRHIKESLDKLNGSVAEQEKRLRMLEIARGKLLGIAAAVSVVFSFAVVFVKTKFLGG